VYFVAKYASVQREDAFSKSTILKMDVHYADRGRSVLDKFVWC
jgi:primosomal replication protein N